MNAILFVPKSFLNDRLKFSDFSSIFSKESGIVGDFEDDLWFGERVGEFEARVAGIIKNSREEAMEFGFEDTISNMLSFSVFVLSG